MTRVEKRLEEEKVTEEEKKKKMTALKRLYENGKAPMQYLTVMRSDTNVINSWKDREEEWDEDDVDPVMCDRSECGMCDENRKTNVSKIRGYLRHEPACQGEECAQCRARRCRGCCEEILRQDRDMNLCGRWGKVKDAGGSDGQVVIDLVEEDELTWSTLGIEVLDEG